MLQKDYQVYGLYRRSSTNTFERINHLMAEPNFYLIEGDITDATGINRIINHIKPDECYNLAAMSHVGTSFNDPVATFTIDAIGPLNILEAIRQNSPNTKFYQASTSELFGNTTVYPQDEHTPMMPRSPYGVAKLAAHQATRLYREAYKIYACAGILFNHEGPRRGENFVTRKISRYVAELYHDLQHPHTCDNIIKGLDSGYIMLAQNHILNKPLKLGNLDAKRDWGYALDFVEAMWLMLQQERPRDFVIATNETHSIREFLDEAFKCIEVKDWSNYVVIDDKYKRPTDVNLLCGDYSKAKEKLGWEPTMRFKALVRFMVKADIARGRD